MHTQDTEEASTQDAIVQELQALADAMGRRWLVRCTHLERVKWYAPHVRHVVLDVWCAAPEVPAPAVEVISKTTNAPEDTPHDRHAATQGASNAAPPAPTDAHTNDASPHAPWSLRWKGFGAVPTIALPRSCTAATFASLVTDHRAPAVLQGVDLGPCVARWDPAYLTNAAVNPDASTRVGVHVCTEPHGRMAFVPSRNFTFETMTLGELVQRSMQQGGTRCESAGDVLQEGSFVRDGHILALGHVLV